MDADVQSQVWTHLPVVLEEPGKFLGAPVSKFVFHSVPVAGEIGIPGVSEVETFVNTG